MTANGKSRVTSIAVKRVHNLGNYENIQYEVVVEIGEKDEPGKILQALENILTDVQAPLGSDHTVRRAKEVLSKPANERTDSEKGNVGLYHQVLKDYKAASKRREKAKIALATFNYTSSYKDAKLGWDDEY